MRGRPLRPEGGRAGRGFTLLEVLVALAVLALAVAAVVSEVGGYARESAHLKERTLAQWVAADEVTALRLQGAWPAPGVLQGRSEMAGRAWRWAVRVSRTQDPDVRRLDVEVRPEEAEAPAARLVAYLPRPRRGSAGTGP